MTIEDQPKPFLEHLADLRMTLRGCLAAWGNWRGARHAVGFPPVHPLRAPLAKITEHPEQFLRSLEITGGCSIALRMVLLDEACIWIVWPAERKRTAGARMTDDSIKNGRGALPPRPFLHLLN